MQSAAHLADPPANPSYHKQWVPALLRFNLDPASYAHPSWVPEQLPSLARGVWPQYDAAVSAGLLAQSGVEDSFDWLMDHPASRLFMVDAASLELLALAVGIAAHRGTFRRIIQGPHILALRAGLGDQMDVLSTPMAQAVPLANEVLSLTLVKTEAAKLKPVMIEEGLRQMLRMLDVTDPLQRASARRALLCVHKSWASQVWPSLPKAQSVAMAQAIVKHVVTRWTPSWTWLF